MKQIKYAKNGKESMLWGNYKNIYPLIEKLLVSRPVEKFQWTSIYFQAIEKTAGNTRLKRQKIEKVEKELLKPELQARIHLFFFQ